MYDSGKDRIIHLVALGLLGAILFPYILAWRAAGDEFVFGGFLFNPLDSNTYLAKMYQGYLGKWKYSLPYTASVEGEAYLFLFYIFLGHAARLLGATLAATYHVARVLSGLFLVWIILRFLMTLQFKSQERNLALILILFGSGWGWIAVTFGVFTSDLWVAEAYPFLSSFANPHFPLAIALMVWLLTPEDAGRIRDRGWLTTLAALVLAIISPFGVVIVLFVLGALGIWEVWERTDRLKNLEKLDLLGVSKKAISVSVGGGPILAYYFWVVNAKPAFVRWNAQNLTPSPPPWDILISFSPVLLLAALGAWSIYRTGTRNQRILLVWAGLGVFMAYVPLELQRRFLMGLYVPLAGLAILGIRDLFANNRKVFFWSGTILILLSIPTNLVILLTSIFAIQTRDPFIYLYRNELRAMEWIVDNSSTDAVILAAPDTGLFIPAHTGRRVIYGHPFETVEADKMEAVVESYFQGDLKDSDEIVIKQADYIFVGPREKLLGGCPCVGKMSAVYESEDVSIYRSTNSLVRSEFER